jgi:hypothetical protein
MDLALLLNLVSTFTLIAGTGFGLVQLRFYRSRRQREAILTLVHSYETQEFVHAMRVVLDPAIPDDLPGADLERRLAGEMDAVWLLLTTWESMGVLVCRGEIDLETVDDFFSGVIALSWRRLRHYVTDHRAAIGRETYFEWFQWLAERFAERETQAPPRPAYVAERAWRPADR